MTRAHLLNIVRQRHVETACQSEPLATKKLLAVTQLCAEVKPANSSMHEKRQIEDTARPEELIL